MRVATITAPRVAIGYGFCEQTLRDMVAKDPSFSTADLGVFVDHEIAPKVPEGTFVHMTPPAEMEAQKNVCIRLTLNLARALDWISEMGGVGCVFEDDVLVSRDWHTRTVALARAASTVSPDYLITLHHFYLLDSFKPLRNSGYKQDKLMHWLHRQAFYGNHGLCMTANVARKFAATIREKMALPLEQALPWYADMGVNKMISLHDVRLLSAHPCLCKHVGVVSAVGHISPTATNYFEE